MLWAGYFPGDPENWPTPDAACAAQHAYYNPGATLRPATYNGGTVAECNWDLNENSNTILSAWAYAHCPEGWATFGNGSCGRPDPQTGSRFNCNCKDGVYPITGSPQPSVGNPVALNHSAKTEREIDYASAEARFGVERRYYSLPPDFTNTFSPTEIAGFGARWHGVIPGRITVGGEYAEYLEYHSTDGSFDLFYANDESQWTYNIWPGAQRLRLTFVTTPSVDRPEFFFSGAAVQNGPGEMRLQFAQGEYILFRRTEITAYQRRVLVPIEHGWADGYKITYQYPDKGEFPSLVTDSFGRQMALTWADAERLDYKGLDPVKTLTQVTLPDATTLRYTYGVDVEPRGGRIRDRLETVKRVSATGTVLWGRTYLYENPGVPYALTGKLDQNGQRLSTYSYDVAGQVKSTELAGGVNKFQIESLEYTDNGSAWFYRNVTNPLGYRQDYVFFKEYNNPDAQRVLQSVTRTAAPGIEASTTNYNYYGSIGDRTIADHTNERGVAMHYDIDEMYRPLSTTEAVDTADTRTTLKTWHPTYDFPTQVETPGLTTDYTYSPSGQLLTVAMTDTTTQTVPYSTAGQKRQWTYAWNGNGRLSSINGPKGVDLNGKDDLTVFTYDTSGNLLTSTNALGHVTTFAQYDSSGRPGKMTDANGIDTLFAYDPLGRVKTVTVKHPTIVAQDAITTLDYDIEGRIVGVTLPATDKMFIDYDLAGRMTAVRAASGEQIAYTYDAMGDVTAETVKRANASTARAITRTFDGLGRMVTETLGTNRTTTFAYDKMDNVVKTTSARSNATLQAFDALERLTATTAPDTGKTGLVYDAHDDAVSFKDAKSVTTTFVRNGFGDIIREVSPDRGTTTHYYDLAGDRIATIDGRNQRVDLIRDALGRIVKKTPVGKPASEIVTFGYDVAGLSGSYGRGRLATVTDATGTTAFRYDHRGNLLTKQQAIGTSTAATLAYGYDLADRVISMTYPSGRVVSYARDTKGRVTTVKTRPTAAGADTTLASGLQYEAFGPLLSATLGNGLSMAQSWGNDGRLASKRLYQTAGGTNLSQLTYGYDNDDNIASITDGVDATRSVTYSYDSVGRLSRSVVSGGSVRRQDFSYDLNGNRKKVEGRTNAGDANPVSTATYTTTTGKNRLASIADGSGTRTISYDGSGNTSAESRPGSIAASVGYDGYGRLASYARSDITTLTHGYNGLDDRVTSGTASDMRRFVYDADGRMLGEYGASASDVKAETIWLSPEVSGDAQPFGGEDGAGGYVPLAIAAGSTLYWVHGNHLGVPAVTTTASGAAAAPTGFTRIGFPGQTQTLGDVYYNRYRDYDPTTGRYIQADPIGLEGGDNIYAYAENNPVRWIDTKGLNPVGALVGGAIGGAAGGLLGTTVCAELGPGAVICGLAGRTAGRKLGERLGDIIGTWCGTVLEAQNNKQTRKIIASLERHIEKHRQKIEKDPNSEDVPHWKSEIKAAIERVEKLRKRLPNGR